MQMSGKRACSYLPECRLSYTKIMQVERNGKSGKRSFTRLDTAECRLSYTKIRILSIKEVILSLNGFLLTYFCVV